MAETDTLEKPKIEEITEEHKDIFSDENLKPIDVSTLFTEKKPEVEAIVEKPEDKKEDEEIVDDEVYLEKQLGFKTWDAAKAELEKLRKEKGEGVFKFANEESEKIFKLIKDGKKEEVYKHLHEQQVLSNVKDMKAEDVLKLHLQKENPDYSPEDVQDLYDEKYSLTAKPEQSIEETDEEYQNRVASWQKKNDKDTRRIERDAKNAKSELSKKVSEIVLPDIPKAEPETPKVSQEELAMIEGIRNGYLQSLESGVKNFNGYSATYKDEEVELPVAVEVPKERKSNLKERLENFDFDGYWQSRYFDGKKWDAEKLMQDIDLLENRDAIFTELVNRAGSYRITEAEKRRNNINVNGRSKGVARIENSEHMDKMAEKFFNS